jgi:hypothetical protein
VLAGGVAHPHDAVRHLHDLPRVAAEEEHVALGGFDGEVLVDRADEHVARLHQHPIVARLRDRSARGEGGQPGATAAAEPPVDAVAMQVGHAPPAAGVDAGRDEVDDLLELRARQPPIRPGPGDQAIQLVLGHALLAPRRRLGHDLLGEDVQGPLGWMERIEASAPDRGQQRSALDQLVPRGRVHDPPGDTRAMVVGPPHPLQEGGDAMGRADLAHQLDRPDVDAQLQRRGGHQGPQVACPQAVLDALAALSRQRSVMGGHLVLAQPLAQLMGDPLGQLPGVDEHQGRPVTRDVGGDAVEDLVELIAREGGLELAVGQLQGDVESAPMAAVDDGGRRLARSHQEPGCSLDRLDRRR